MRAFLGVVAVVVALGSSASWADPLAPPGNPAAVEKLKEGNRYYQLRDFSKAVEAYRAGYLLEPSPLFLYNLGQSFRFVGRLEDSIEHYKSFLREAKPEGKLREYVEKFIDEQSAELARQRQAKRLETERAARERERKAQEQQARSSRSVAAPPTDVEPWYRDTLGWSLGGAGIAVFGVGLGLFINGAYVRGDAENASNQSAAEDEFRRADIQQLAGGAAMAVGAGLVIGGVVRLIATDTPAEGLVVLTPPSGLVVGLGGTF